MRCALLALLLSLGLAAGAAAQAPWSGPTFTSAPLPAAPGGRLTLCSGRPVYAPQAATPASTDTTAETTTFTHETGWCTGTMVTPSATGGGLTAGTTYWINATSTTAVSYHTTLANAEAGTSKVNLTANITAEIQPFGIQSTTVRYTAYVPSLATSGQPKANASTASVPFYVPLWTGSSTTAGHIDWVRVESELSLSLTATSGNNYNVYLSKSGLTAALSLGAAWTSDVIPSETLASPLGGNLPVLSGTPTKLFVGVGRAAATNAFEDSAGGVVSQVGGKRFLSNAHNRVRCAASVRDGAASWTYNGGFRQFNGAAGNKVEYVTGQPTPVSVDVLGEWYAALTTGLSRLAMVGIGLDSTTARTGPALRSYASASGTSGFDAATPLMASWRGVPGIGYHYLAAIETSLSLGTVQFTGGGSTTTSSEAGLVAVLEC